VKGRRTALAPKNTERLLDWHNANGGV